MSGFNFACQFLKVEDGTEIIRCRDLPELLSWPSNGETPEKWARYAVEDCISFRMKDGELVPEASEPQEGELVVSLTKSAEAKILLHNEMVKGHISRAEFARRAGMRLPDVTRLLNIKHQTKLDTIDNALRVVGKQIKLSIVSI